MTTKLILMLSGSALAGAAAGILGTMTYFKKKYDKVAQNKIDEIRKFYKERDQYASYAGETQEEEPQENPVENMTDEERAEIKAKLKKNWSQTTNYASYYKKNNQIPETEEEIVEETAPPVLTEEEWEDRMKNRNRPPKLISSDDLEGLPEYIEMENMFYYTYDDTITDEDDQVIEDYKRYLGDCLEKYNFPESDEITIYVRNYEYDKVYEITKVESNYTLNKMYENIEGGND